MVDAIGIAGTTAAARVAQIAVRMASNDWVDDTKFHVVVVDRLWQDPLNGSNCAIKVWKPSPINFALEKLTTLYITFIPRPKACFRKTVDSEF